MYKKNTPPQRSPLHCAIITVLLYLLSIKTPTYGWGFFAHKKINRYAVFTLPPAMLLFYKYHIQYLTDNAINPDKRRYVVVGEDSKHYIDIDYYGDQALWQMPRHWTAAKAMYTATVLQQHGTLPWHIITMKHRLTQAFLQQDAPQILRLSADIGHYIADAHVPLHTTQNYDGQATDQQGIHGLWESRLPELFTATYHFFVGAATYLQNPRHNVWEAIITAHQAINKLLTIEKQLSASFPAHKKYVAEQRGTSVTKTYSQAYAQAYHTRLQGQVEKQMQAAVKMVGDFWYTCWVDAGTPPLHDLLKKTLPPDALQENFDITQPLLVRPQED